MFTEPRIPVLKEDQSQDFIHASKELARLLHVKENFEAAKDVIYEAVKKYPTVVTSEGLDALKMYCNTMSRLTIKATFRAESVAGVARVP